MEAAPLNTSFYKEALIVLGAAAIVIPLFHRLHVSSVLGFMLVGVAVGPFGLASLTSYLPWLSAVTISEPESIEPIAHLGVVLLLFMIGLELDEADLPDEPLAIPAGVKNYMTPLGHRRMQDE